MSERVRGAAGALSGLAVASVVVAAGALAMAADLVAAAPVPEVRIVGEWQPGHSADELGGRLLGYGIGGLGAYSLQLDDSTVVLAVCVQADVGHSLVADYVLDPSPAVTSAELDYLLWRHLPPGGLSPTDDVAAAINALSWRYTDAQRGSGGPVWRDDDLEVAVVGHGRLPNVERVIGVLGAEASANRGPWTLHDLTTRAGPGATSVVSVRLRGPGGPIADRPVTFRVGPGAPVVASTGDDGMARASLPAGPHGQLAGRVMATAEAPGAADTYAAVGSQRVAVAGRPVPLSITLDVPPPTTTTTTTTTTTPTTTTTTTTTLPPTTTTLPPNIPPTSTTTLPPNIPPTSTTTLPPPPTIPPTSTIPPTTTTTTTPIPPTTLPPPTTTATLPPTTTTLPPPTTTITPTTTTTPTNPPPTLPPGPVPPADGPPPTLPRTGSAARSTARWASLLFAVGSLAVLGGASGRRGGARWPRRGV